MIELQFRFDAALRELVQPGARRVDCAPSLPADAWLEIWVRLADEKCRHAGSTTT
jgi:hypothetical protein